MASFDITFETEEELAATFEATVQTPAEEETVSITIYNTNAAITVVYYPSSATWTGFEPSEETGAVSGIMTIPVGSVFLLGVSGSSMNVHVPSGYTATKLSVTGTRIMPHYWMIEVGDADGTVSAG